MAFGGGGGFGGGFGAKPGGFGASAGVRRLLEKRTARLLLELLIRTECGHIPKQSRYSDKWKLRKRERKREGKQPSALSRTLTRALNITVTTVIAGQVKPIRTTVEIIKP